MSSAPYLMLLFSGLWGYTLCGIRKFNVVKEEKNWTNAQKYCREKFTDLATIESQEDMDTVNALVSGITNHFWIGLKPKLENNITKHSFTLCEKIMMNGPIEMLQNSLDKILVPLIYIESESWIWSDGSKASYRNWNTGQPKIEGSDYCGELRSEDSYRWTVIECTLLHQFICYEEKRNPLILVEQSKTWREALRYCRDHFEDLVSVHTVEIQHWVEFVTERVPTLNVWTGLRHTCAQNFWFWVSGSTMCYQNWAPGNGRGVEDCSEGERAGAIQSGSKQWISLPETQKLYFICTTV